MSIKYEFRGNICYITAEGKYSKADLDHYFQLMRNAPEFKDCYGILLYDAKSSFVPTVSEIKSTAFGLREFIGGFQGKIALVVESSVKYGLGRMLEALSSDPGIRVFKSLKDANEWLA